MRKTALCIFIILTIMTLFVFVGCEVQPEQKLVSISIDRDSFLSNYYVGEVIDYSNATLTLIYNNNTTDNISITEDMVTGFSTTTEGTYTLKVRYEGLEVTHIYRVSQRSVEVTISEVIPTGFKTEYLRNEALSLQDAQVRVIYSNGEDEVFRNIETSSVSGFNSKSVTTQGRMTVSINTIRGKATCTVNYTVTAPPTLDSFVVLSTVNFVFQEEDSINILYQRLQNYQYQATYSDGTIVTLSYDATKMTVTNFVTDTAGTRELTLKYTDSLDRSKSIRLSYEVIEKVPEYQVTYNYDNVISNFVTMTVYGKAPRRDGYERVGYDFKGWYSEEYYGNNINRPWDFDTPVTEKMTLYAWWTLKEYSIVYVGAGQNSQNEKYNNTYNIATNTFELYEEAKVGYNFDGYYNEQQEKIERIQKGSTGNMVLTAKWTPTSYNIAYNYEGGKAPQGGNPNTYTIEDSIVFGEPTKLGYEFLGWKNNATATFVEGITVGSMGAISLTANWEIIEYTIKYNLSGGEEVQGAITKYTIVNETIILVNAKKDGYTFLGWYRDKNFESPQTTNSENKYVIVKGSHENIELWPKFIVNYQIVFMVAAGGEILESLYFTANDATVSLPLPENNGHTFTGWKASNGTVFSEGNTDTSWLIDNIDYGISLILTAQWQEIEYNIIYKSADGLTVYKESSYAATSKNLWNPSEVLPEGYDFRGWAEDIGQDNELFIWSEKIPPIVYRDLVLYVILW